VAVEVAIWLRGARLFYGRVLFVPTPTLKGGGVAATVLFAMRLRRTRNFIPEDSMSELGVQADMLSKWRAHVTLLYPLGRVAAPCHSDLLLWAWMKERTGEDKVPLRLIRGTRAEDGAKTAHRKGLADA
jgi:hypothetical protein